MTLIPHSQPFHGLEIRTSMGRPSKWSLLRSGCQPGDGEDVEAVVEETGEDAVVVEAVAHPWVDQHARETGSVPIRIVVTITLLGVTSAIAARPHGQKVLEAMTMVVSVADVVGVVEVIAEVVVDLEAVEVWTEDEEDSVEEWTAAAEDHGEDEEDLTDGEVATVETAGIGRTRLLISGTNGISVMGTWE